MRIARSAVVAALLAAGGALSGQDAEPPESVARYRGPRAMYFDADARRAFIANEASESVSVVAIDRGEVVAEIDLTGGSHPQAIAGVAVAGGRTLVAVSATYRHELAWFELDCGSERVDVRDRGTIAVGRAPGGLEVYERDGSLRVVVACEGSGEVWDLSLAAAGPPPRILSVIEGPRRLVRHESRSGDALLTVAGRTEVAQYDASSGRELWSRAIASGQAFNLEGLAVSGERVHVVHQLRPTEMGISPTTIVWGLIIVNRLTVLEPIARDDGSFDVRSQATSLDFRHRAAGDPTAVTLLADRGKAPPRALVLSGGTDRLLQVDVVPRDDGYSYGSDPLDREGPMVETRVGRRPVAVALSRDHLRAFVLSALDDRLDEVDLETAKVVRRIALGPRPEASRSPSSSIQVAHSGARIFYDARRSRGGWYSCNSCHPDGGTRGHLFDTGADGEGFSKRAPDLRGVPDTAPWAWEGTFGSLGEQIGASLETTMAVDHPASDRDVERVSAFLAALSRPLARTPGEDLGGDPERGRRAFGEADCESCHPPPTFTIAELRDVGVHDEDDGQRKFSPPSLRGLRDRFRHLHDARASSLWSVFREHDKRARHGRAHGLSDDSLRDLIAFLKTL